MTNPLDPQSNYNVPKGNTQYLRFDEEVTEFLPLDSAIVGWEYWNTDEKPVRLSEEPEDHASLPGIRKEKDGTYNVKHFWAFPVIDMLEVKPKVKVLEITQKGVMKAIRSYTTNPKWGSPVMKYSFTVKKEGEGLKTKYETMANPAGELSEGIKTVWENAKMQGFDLTRLFNGGDPFVADPDIDGSDAPDAQ